MKQDNSLKFNHFGWYLISIFLWLLVLTACIPSSQTITPLEITRVVVSKTPMMSTRQPIATVPNEIEELFDKTNCSEYCWQGVMLNQTEEEAINGLQSYFGNEARYEVERYEESFIFWPSAYELDRNIAVIENDHVTQLSIGSFDTITFGTILAQYGEPDLVGIRSFARGGKRPEEQYFDVVYFGLRMSMFVSATEIHGKPSLELNSQVYRITFSLLDEQDNYKACHWYHMVEWRGLGGINAYYNKYGEPLYLEGRLDDCPGWD